MIIAVYKPKGPTSNDMVQMVKKAARLMGETRSGKAAGIKKVGHAGTLDPLASGVLVVGIGREATKKLAEVVKKEKEYIADIKLGQTSTTDDQEGAKSTPTTNVRLAKSDIEEVVKKFVGKIKQTPPKYSAVKVGGREAYKYARRGLEIKLKPREVEIKSIEILNYKWPNLKLKVITGPGVYIRSLARDIGQELGTGAYLAELERTRVGQFTKEKAVSFDKIVQNNILKNSSF